MSKCNSCGIDFNSSNRSNIQNGSNSFDDLENTPQNNNSNIKRKRGNISRCWEYCDCLGKMICNFSLNKNKYIRFKK